MATKCINCGNSNQSTLVKEMDHAKHTTFFCRQCKERTNVPKSQGFGLGDMAIKVGTTAASIALAGFLGHEISDYMNGDGA